MPDSADPGDRWELEAEAPAKLNLALFVGPRRDDGYHEIDTVFQAIDLADTVRARRRPEPGIELRVTGPEPIPPGGGENLVERAARRVSDRLRPSEGAVIELVKRIPVGAGLGGGSSDAAAAVVLLERLWGGTLESTVRERLAAELGSDVPFFLRGGTARGRGRGEILTALDPPPEAWWILAIPGVRVSTAEAYQNLDILRQAAPDLTSAGKLDILAKKLRHLSFATFIENLQNDFQQGVFRMHPQLALLRDALLRCGASAVGLTGSGSALFALTCDQGVARRLSSLDPEQVGARMVPCRPVDHGVRVHPAVADPGSRA